MNETQHQGATCLREIQDQVNMDSYTGTLSVMHVTIMENFPINVQIKTESNKYCNDWSYADAKWRRE